MKILLCSRCGREILNGVFDGKCYHCWVAQRQVVEHWRVEDVEALLEQVKERERAKPARQQELYRGGVDPVIWGEEHARNDETFLNSIDEFETKGAGLQ